MKFLEKLHMVRASRMVFWMVGMLLLLNACQTAPMTSPVAQWREIDRLLVLIDQRLDVATEVAQAKWNSGAAIDDPVRESKILHDLATTLPDAAQADRDFILHFFQAQFDAGKIIQRSLHAQWLQQRHPPFSQPPDLSRDIRPELDRLTPMLIISLRQVRPLLTNASARAYLKQRAEQLVAVNDEPAVRQQAIGILLTSP